MLKKNIEKNSRGVNAKTLSHNERKPHLNNLGVYKNTGVVPMCSIESNLFLPIRPGTGKLIFKKKKIFSRKDTCISYRGKELDFFHKSILSYLWSFYAKDNFPEKSPNYSSTVLKFLKWAGLSDGALRRRAFVTSLEELQWTSITYEGIDRVSGLLYTFMGSLISNIKFVNTKKLEFKWRIEPEIMALFNRSQATLLNIRELNTIKNYYAQYLFQMIISNGFYFKPQPLEVMYQLMGRGGNRAKFKYKLIKALEYLKDNHIIFKYDINKFNEEFRIYPNQNFRGAVADTAEVAKAKLESLHEKATSNTNDCPETPQEEMNLEEKPTTASNEDISRAIREAMNSANIQ